MKNDEEKFKTIVPSNPNFYNEFCESIGCYVLTSPYGKLFYDNGINLVHEELEFLNDNRLKLKYLNSVKNDIINELEELKSLDYVNEYVSNLKSALADIDLILPILFSIYLNSTDSIIKVNSSDMISNRIKLKWNGNKNALVDVFLQLSQLTNKKNEYLLDNSESDIYKFIIETFSGFEDDNPETLRNYKKEEKRPKGNNKIEIVLKDESE